MVMADELNDIPFKDIKPPGIFMEAELRCRIAYSGEPGPDARVHMVIEAPDNIIILQPAIEAMMVAWAKADERGVEKAIEVLSGNALWQLKHHKRVK